jgi:copper(I)-binding protein
MPESREKMTITLPDKTNVTVPAAGPLDFRIGGFHVMR